jgi:putative MFS transporter
LAEFIPSESRGKYLLLIEYYWTLGSMLVPIIAYYAIEIQDSWRLFVILCAVPCLISLIAGMKFVPESPRWLIMKGRNEEALDILRRAAMVNGKDPQELFPPGYTIRTEVAQEEASYKELFKPKWRRLTLILFVVWMGFALCYYGTIMAVTRIFDESNNGNNGDDNVAAAFDYSAILISSSAEANGTTLAIAMVDRIGRIPTIVGSYLWGGITVFSMCFFVEQLGRPALITISFLARICEMIASCTIWILTAELFSTEIRSTGHSATNAVSRLGGFLSPYLIAGTIPFRTIAIIFLAIHLIAAFFASRLPETNGVELGKAAITDHKNMDPISQYETSGTELI